MSAVRRVGAIPSGFRVLERSSASLLVKLDRFDRHDAELNSIGVRHDQEAALSMLDAVTAERM